MYYLLLILIYVFFLLKYMRYYERKDTVRNTREMVEMNIYTDQYRLIGNDWRLGQYRIRKGSWSGLKLL
jgi:hypothetical protein